MSIKALDGIEKQWYTPIGERKKKDAAKFLLRPLTSPQLLEVQCYLDLKTLRVNGQGLYLAFANSVIGWENVFQKDGDRMPFNMINKDKIPPAILAELGGEAVRMSMITEEDLKNS